MRIVAADIGGTRARFALAEIEAGRVVKLHDTVVLTARDYPGVAQAWRQFSAELGEPLPPYAAIAVAAPVRDGLLRFTNSPWVIDPAVVAAELGTEQTLLLNDFGAMAHAVHGLGGELLVHLCGPDIPLPRRGAISVIGPGTGLGVAILLRRAADAVVLETEGAHAHFAPLDETERQVSAAIAARHGRTSIERLVSGPGLGEILRTFAPGDTRSDAELWAAAIGGEEPLSRNALDLFLASFGAVAGDYVLAHGSIGLAVTGGLAYRLRPLLQASRFHARFCDKGRYESLMKQIPIRLVTHPQPGLFGAAAAFALEYGTGVEH